MSQRPRFTLRYSESDKENSCLFIRVSRPMSMDFTTLREAKEYYELLEPKNKRRIIDNVNNTCVLIDEQNKYLVE